MEKGLRCEESISLPQAAFRKVAMAQAFQDVAWLWSAVLLF
jgi:hypothetical protein